PVTRACRLVACGVVLRLGCPETSELVHPAAPVCCALRPCCGRIHLVRHSCRSVVFSSLGAFDICFGSRALGRRQRLLALSRSIAAAVSCPRDELVCCHAKRRDCSVVFSTTGSRCV